MKVLLINENRCRGNLVPYPLGLAYVARALKDSGHEVFGLDLMFSEHPEDDLVEAIEVFGPDVIGLSVRNIDNQDRLHTEFYLPPVKGLVEVAQARADAPIVLGGTGFTIFPTECLEYLDLQLGVVGEGEYAFPRLVECLEEGGNPAGMPGLAVRRNGMSQANAPPKPLDFSRSAIPDREAFDVSRYNWKPGPSPPFVANMQSRRGCHMRCIYCSSPLVEGRNLRLRDPESVVSEMEILEKQYGIEFVFFTDSLFNLPGDYTKVLLQAIEGRDLSVEWTAIINPVNPDPELICLLPGAGCTSVSLGNESGSEDMLRALRKEFATEDIVTAARELKRAGVETRCFLLLGGPGETRRSVEESIELLTDIEPDGVSVTVGIRIYPGCELADIALAEGVIEPGQNLLFPAFYVAPEAEPWLDAYMEEVCREREGWEM